MVPIKISCHLSRHNFFLQGTLKNFSALLVNDSNLFFSLYEDDYDLVCNTVGNKDASEQRIRQAASGYDIWKSNPLNADGGDPGKRKQIFEINCE